METFPQDPSDDAKHNSRNEVQDYHDHKMKRRERKQSTKGKVFDVIRR